MDDDRGNDHDIAPHLRVQDHGFIGDTRTGALIDPGGSITWLCLPRFDGEPVFAGLVGGTDGGRFTVGPTGITTLSRRRYWPGCAVLDTEWRAPSGRVRATDGMIADVDGTALPTTCIVRRIEALDGPAEVTIEFDPRFGDARRRGRFRTAGQGVACDHRGTALWLAADQPLVGIERDGARVRVEPGAPLTVVLTAAHREPLTFVDPSAAWDALLADAARWRRWSSTIEFDGFAVDAVRRSLITLRLLTYSPSGAPIAAPTTSLPELVGGSRNWDYRFAWPRDASIGVGAFLGTDLVEHARAFLYWLLHASRLDRPRLAPLLTVYGTPVPTERELDWPGFAGSRPVRLGNGARDQHQLDNYGWLLDAMWMLESAGHSLYRETWRAGQVLADEVARRWPEPDAGIWEERGAPEHHVHSKLMAWLALDRALRIAERQRTPDRRKERWARARDALGSDVRERGVDRERDVFVRAYGRHDSDAALLLLPLIGLELPRSERIRRTIAAIRTELDAGGPLLYRYRPGDDGLDEPEGAFLPCSFWLVQALAATGDLDEACRLFDELTAIAGPLGLFAEEVDPTTGSMVGNYPQALTHAALVQAALAIRDAQDGLSSTPSATP